MLDELTDVAPYPDPVTRAFTLVLALMVASTSAVDAWCRALCLAPGTEVAAGASDRPAGITHCSTDQPTSGVALRASPAGHCGDPHADVRLAPSAKAADRVEVAAPVVLAAACFPLTCPSAPSRILARWDAGIPPQSSSCRPLNLRC